MQLKLQIIVYLQQMKKLYIFINNLDEICKYDK